MKNWNKIMVWLSCILMVSIFTIGCSGGYENKLASGWYREGSGELAFILYDDGTCEVPGEYGTGLWSVVNGNQLKLTTFYGETETVTIKSVHSDKFIIDDGAGGEMTFWKNADKAQEMEE